MARPKKDSLKETAFRCGPLGWSEMPDLSKDDERLRLIEQRRWAVQLMAPYSGSDPHNAVRAAKVLVEYMESGE